MAVLKQRLHKKNSSGTYDTVHLETSANLVKRTDGTHNVEESLSAIESWDIIRYDDAGEAPITPINADTLQGHPASYFAPASSVPAPYVHPATKQCNYSYSHPATKQCDAVGVQSWDASTGTLYLN